MLILGAVAACICRAQPTIKTPAELSRDLRGDPGTAWFPAGSSRLPSPANGQQRPTGESVSIAQLRHKVPKPAQKALARALRLSEGGDHEKAAAELQTAILRDPKFADAYGQLGVEYGNLKRFTEAETVLRRSLELDPNSWRAEYDLGLILYYTGNLAEAEQSVRRAVRDSGQDALAQLFLGCLLYQHAESRAEGLRYLQSAARTLPDAKNLLAKLPAP